MTVIAQDDHLTAGAWAACGLFMERSTILIFWQSYGCQRENSFFPRHLFLDYSGSRYGKLRLKTEIDTRAASVKFVPNSIRGCSDFILRGVK